MSKIVTAEKKKGKKKVEEKPVEETEETQELSEEELQQELEALMSAMTAPKPSPASELRVAQLYGEIDDKMATDIISAFLILQESGKEEVLEEGGVRYIRFSQLTTTRKPPAARPSAHRYVWT